MKLSLTKKTILAIIIISLPLIITFALTFNSNRQNLRQTVLDNLSVMAELYETQVYQFFDMHKRRVADFASDGFIRKTVEAYNGGDLGAVEGFGTYLAEEKLALDDNIAYIQILAPDGKVVGSTDETLLGDDHSGDEFFLEGLERVVLKESLHSGSDHIDMAFAAPINSMVGDDVIGVIVNYIRPPELSEILSGEYLRDTGALSWDRGKAETMEVYLVDENGELLTTPESLVGKSLPDGVNTYPIDKCIGEGREVSDFYIGPNGRRVAGVSMCIKGFGWTLLVEVDEEEIMEPMRGILRGVTFAALVMASLIGLLFVLFLRWVVRPLNELSYASQRLSSGDYTVSLPVRSRDEVGALAATFNSMVSELGDRKMELLQSKEGLDNAQRIAHIGNWGWDIATGALTWSDEVYRIFGHKAGAFAPTYEGFIEHVHPDDREALQRAVDSALKGIPYSIDHRILTADGVEAVVQERGEVIFSEDGKPSRMNGTVQDITKLNEALLSLRRSESRFRSITDNTNDGIVTAASDGKIVFWNRGASEIFGYLEEEAFHTSISELFAEGLEGGGILGGVVGALKEKNNFTVELTGLRKGGDEVPLEVSVSRWRSGEDVFLSAIIMDLTQRRGTEEAMKTLARFPSENPNPVLRVSCDGRILYVNSPCGPLLELWGVSVDDYLPDEWRSRVVDACADQEIILEEVTYSKAVYSLRITPVEGADYLYIYGLDITEQKDAELELRKLSTAIDHSDNIVFITNRAGEIEYVNPKFEAVTGYSREDAMGNTPRILSSDFTTDEEYKNLWNTINSGSTWRGVLKNRTKDGKFYWSNGVISPIKDEKGNITNFLSVQENVTDRMESEERIRYLVEYDEITGLLNRSHFIESLEGWIASHGVDTQGILILLDLDQFKLVNDTYGHSVGDEVIRRVGKLLDISLRFMGPPLTKDLLDSSILGRLGADEFAIFIPSIAIEDAGVISEYIRVKVEEFNPAEIQSYITASLGVVAYPEHGVSTKELLSKADTAQFRAKEEGRNRYHIYRPEDGDLERMHSRIHWKERIIEVIKEDRFVPWFQPIMNVETGEISHYEALARMIDEEGKILFPGAFIPIAESFDIIGSIDRVIIEKTLRKQAAMMAEGKRYSFSTNISGKDLGDPDLLDFLQEKIKETGADADCLVFEITETAAVSDLDQALAFMTSLRKTGCHFSLDDFGAGFTSFRYLKIMDVDYIKIDGSFIRKLDEDVNDQLFVKAINSVAKGLGVKTVAEFVENEKVLLLLEELGVDYAQGYHIGKPQVELIS